MSKHDLITLADYLDENGFHKEAEEVDALAQKWKKLGNRVPEDLANVSVPAAFDMLRRRIVSYDNDANIDSKTIGWVLRKINEVAQEIDSPNLRQQKSVPEESAESSGKVYYVRPNVITIAEGVANLAQDIEKSFKKLRDPNISEDKKENIKNDIRGDRESIRQNYQMLNNFATPDEQKIFAEYFNSVMTGNEGSVVLKPEKRVDEPDRRMPSGVTPGIEPLKDQYDKRIEYV
jgi:hypothetical protein